MDRQKLLGIPFTFEHNGITYSLSHETQRVKGEFERWAKTRAIKDRLADKGMVPESIIENQLNRLYEAFDSSDTNINYLFEGRKCQELLETNDGRMAYIRILLGKQVENMSENNLQEMVVDKIEEITAFFEASKLDLDRIQAELGWDRAKDPKMETLDPKAKRRLLKMLKAANLY